jgi:methionine-rich copper-binding protein CopC
MKCKNVLPIIMMFLVVLMAGCKKYVDPGIRPVVTSTNPINNATNVAINSKISATFNVAMDPSTITNAKFSLMQGTTLVTGAVEYIGGTSATFSPTTNLSANTLYTATITTGVKDINGKGIIKDYTWSFTTSTSTDLTPPTVTVAVPANNVTGVAVGQAVTITFNEPIDQTSVSALTFGVTQGTTKVPGTITTTATTATFAPTANLLPSTVYAVTVTAGVKDVAGNALGHDYTASFTTANAPDIILPMLNSTDPLFNATNVNRNKIVGITFSKPMNATTINNTTFTLKQGTTPVTGSVAYAGTSATFTPSGNLLAGTVYTATITTGAKDLAGNALAANTVWSFTTGSVTPPPPSTLAVVDLGAAGNYVILAKTTITDVPTSAITGDIGLSPAATSYITGFGLTNATGYATSPQITGKIFAADMVAPTSINLTTAVNNMLTAYTDAAGRPLPDFTELATGNIGGKILTAGLYKWTTNVTIPSSITISGSANDVWIFQISGNLLQSAATNITLSGGAQAKNIFWQVAGQVTIGLNAHFEGIILSQTSIIFQTGASMNGRALAQTAVILDQNAITKP